MKSILFALILLLPLQMFGYRHDFQTVAGDPMGMLMYTLPNGLKIYMSVNKDQPRIQTNIAVRVGSKNDPPETTGLAHYFEHMMFKGTDKFGTSDYAAEKPLLDRIESLFEVYRVTTDSTARAGLYHQIDSISFLASQIAIPNEYDKLMASIGASGTNAYTSYDMTCYVEDIPSNELDRWARIQADRFANPVLRGFHTELETIYEEKNMSLTSDIEKAYDAILAILYPNHPYGQWDILGFQTHLKNPSITNIKNYHKQWYVPNNIAILMAGDFDPDEAVDIIARNFGSMQPNPALPVLAPTADIAITEPKRREVLGNDSEFLLMGWPFPKVSDSKVDTLDIAGAMLINGKAGLIDIDINNRQLALRVNGGAYGQADKSMFSIMAYPNAGQSLEELEALILQELAKLRNGDFDDSLIAATINNYKLQEQRLIESNSGRTEIMQDIFINGYDPADYFDKNNRQSKITKEEITRFARANLRDDNYAVIYKRLGCDTTQLKIPKQPITPLATNRDKTSKFLSEITAETVTPIEPVFVDFNKELEFLTVGPDIPVIYKKNTTNDTFSLTYVYDFGTNNDPQLSLLRSYFPLLGTAEMTNDEIARKFYEIACNYYISIGGDRSYVVISGLSENMPKAVAIVEDLMANAVPDADVYAKVAEQTLKQRADNKLSQRSNFSALQRYVIYGPEQLKAITLTDEQITDANPKDLTDRLAAFNGTEHSVIYYGPMSSNQLVAALSSAHRTPAKLAPAPARNSLKPREPQETIFFVAPYDAKQLYMMEFANDGSTFDPDREVMRQIYNEYFGGSMNSIVFQEMREARSLAYSANAYQQRPAHKGEPYTYRTFIATQNDKMLDAINAFEEIIEQMPESANAFDLAKQGLDSRLRSQRTINNNVAWALISLRDLGIENRDLDKDLFEALSGVTLDDVIKYQQQNVKGRKYYYGILGNTADLDIDALKRRGKVVLLQTPDIFLY